jgi:hypothetical protein
VLVFDPLALVLILAAQQSIKWAREEKEDKWVDEHELTEAFYVAETPIEEPKYEADDGPVDDNILDQIKKMVSKDLPKGEVVATSSLFDNVETTVAEEELPQEPHPPGWMYGDLKSNPLLDEQEVEEVIKEFDISKHAYLNRPFSHFVDLKPMVAQIEDYTEQVKTVDSTEPIVEIVEPPPPPRVPETRNRSKDIMPTPPEAQNVYKKELALQADNVGGQASKSSFGTVFPNNPERSEMFLRVDYLPNKLYKFNGVNWIEVDKAKTDSYTYDEQYILFLIEKLQSGEYEIDQLSASEQELVEEKLKEIADDKT